MTDVLLDTSAYSEPGRHLSLNDIWIAATAFQHGLRIVTTDGDFKAIPQVVVDYVIPWE